VTEPPLEHKSAVRGQILRREALLPATVDDMYQLFSRYFEAHERSVFEADLAGKDAVILLRSGARIVGFSTVRIDHMRAAGEEIAVLVSGDTIIDRDYWATGELERCWLQVALEARQRLERPLYWLLICSGYRTYRYLPTFFRSFWPRPDQPTPPDAQARLDAIATQVYGERYSGGIVRLQGGFLREGVSPVDERHLRNAHVAFFVQANPGHARGDELACIALIDESNFTSGGRKVLARHRSVDDLRHGARQ